jgi:hypothetical protein
MAQWLNTLLDRTVRRTSVKSLGMVVVSFAPSPLGDTITSAMPPLLKQPVREFYRRFDRYLDGELKYEDMWTDLIVEPHQIKVKWKGDVVVMTRVDQSEEELAEVE